MGLKTSIIHDDLKILVSLFEIIRIHLFPQVDVEGCGIYDNIGHGVQTEGDTAIMNTDILCNQRHAVSAEGTANIQVRVYSHIPLKSPFFLPFKNGLNEFPWSRSYMMPLTKTVTLTVSMTKA